LGAHRFQFSRDVPGDDDESEEEESEDDSGSETEPMDDTAESRGLDANAPTDKEWKPPGEREKKGGASRRGGRGVVFDAECVNEFTVLGKEGRVLVAVRLRTQLPSFLCTSCRDDSGSDDSDLESDAEPPAKRAAAAPKRKSTDGASEGALATEALKANEKTASPGGKVENRRWGVAVTEAAALSCKTCY
jgi:hypothetical protein